MTLPNLMIVKNPLGTFGIYETDGTAMELYRREGCWEKSTLEFLRERCFPDGSGLYVDAGAAVGFTSIPVALRHPDVTVYAFEPHPFNRSLLEYNAGLNSLEHNERFIIRPEALSDVQGKAELMIDPRSLYDHRMVRGGSTAIGYDKENERQKIEVETTTLCAVLNDAMLRPRPFVLKMDVQGHEMAILRGLKHLRPDVMIFEYWPYGLSREGNTLGALLLMLEELELRYGTILIEPWMTLVNGLLPKLLATVPWDGKTSTALQIVAARQPEMIAHHPV